jgi:superfamily II DNA helicase RecQ
MKYQFFKIPVSDPGPQTEALNRFLATHGIIAVDRQFVADGGNSFWALAIKYRDSGASSPAAPAADRIRKTKIDYREVLDAKDFAAYADLRALRKEIAEREGVPAYALFTNEQLAAMVQGRVASKADIEAIGGVGKVRVEKYAEAFLKVLAERGDAPAKD